MLRDILKAYRHFYIECLFYRLLPSFFGKEKTIVYSTLRTNVSYRLPESAKDDYLLPARMLRRMFLNNFRHVSVDQVKSNEAIYDTLRSSYKSRKSYLQVFYPEKNYHDLAKDNIINFSSPLFKFFLSIFLVSLVPFLLVSGLFKKNKIRSGLKLIQFAEAAALLNYCRIHAIQKLYYFTIYEPDSNICSFLLKSRGVYVCFVTSEVPMRFGNMKMTANEINFCFGYQLQEYEVYKNDIISEKIRLLIPETVHETATYYIRNNYFDTPKETIGFISSGMWLRKILGDADSGLNELENENKILGWLMEYTQLNPETKLVIYLHPIEKRAENIDLTKKQYTRYFGTAPPQFAPFDIKSSLSFNNSDICVALYSTLIYERIFMGFKSLIVPLGISDFPIKDSVLDRSGAKTKDELFKKLDLFRTLNRDEYVRGIGFESFCYKNFKELC